MSISELLRGHTPPHSKGRTIDIPIICLVVAVYYLSLNWQFTGPTYLTDEIGYLANAAFLAGNQIDGSSSYHFGYSLFLVPSFLLFSDTAIIWKSVLITNVLIFAAAFSVLYLMGEFLCQNRLKRLGFVLLAAAYPAYPTMSGYAYSQPAFVLVFLLCCLVLMKYPRTSYAGMLILGFLVGFLYWIHPTALPVVIAMGIVGIVAIISDRNAVIPVLISIVLSVVLIVLYKSVLHPGIMEAMTPDGFNPRRHYPSVSERLFVLFEINVIIEFFTRFIGQLSYFIISTYSLISAGIIFILGYLLSNNNDDMKQYYLFVLLSILGIFSTVSLFFVKDYGSSLNTWFYGRYAEGVLLPLLYLSLIQPVRRRANLLFSFSVIVVFIALFLISGFSRTWLNLVNVSAFWPVLLPIEENFLGWFSIGAAGCLIGILIPRIALLVLLAVTFGFCTAEQMVWHRGSFGITSTPSGLLPTVRENLTPGSCIGIGSVSEGPRRYPQKERFNLYSFYLYDYNYRRMTPEEWSRDCDGFYLSFLDADQLTALGAVEVGMEAKTGLRLFAKGPVNNTDAPSRDPYFLQTRMRDGNPGYSFDMNADQILPFNGVGEHDGTTLKTTGRSGFLFFGPYMTVQPGPVSFRVLGIANNVDGAWIDVASDGGGTIHGEFPVKSTGGERGVLVEGTIELPAEVSDLEIRMRVRSGSDIRFIGYRVDLPI